MVYSFDIGGFVGFYKNDGGLEEITQITQNDVTE